MSHLIRSENFIYFRLSSQEFISQEISLVTANQKSEKIGQEGILCPHAIFFCNFFALFSSPIYLWRYLKTIFDLSLLVCKSVQKWPQSWNSAKNRLFLEMLWCQFFCFFFRSFFFTNVFIETITCLAFRLIPWKCPKMALKSRFGQKWRPN